MVIDSEMNYELNGFTRVELTNASEAIAQKLGTRVFGQQEAVDAAAAAYVRTQAGFANPERPKIVQFYLGPTGVGKTELAKAMAWLMYGDEWEKHYQRIDCSQFKGKHSVSRLKGADPNYVGYGDKQLITQEFLNQADGTLVLFDEVEKADPALWELLLPVLAEGQMAVFASKNTNDTVRRAEPVTLNFRNSTIIFTSNVGAEQIQRARRGGGIGFDTGQNRQSNIRGIGIDELRKKFSPEFIGRIGEDNVIVFNELQAEQYIQIYEKFLAQLNTYQASQAITLRSTDTLRSWVIDRAVGDGRYGARDIGRYIDRYVTNVAADLKVGGHLREHGTVILDLEGDAIVPWVKHSQPPTATTQIETVAELQEKQPQIMRVTRGRPFTIAPRFNGRIDDQVVEQVILKDNSDKPIGVINISSFMPETVDGSKLVSAYGNVPLYRMDMLLDSHPKRGRANASKLAIGNAAYTGIAEASTDKKTIFTKWQNPKGEACTIVYEPEDFSTTRITIDTVKKPPRKKPNSDQ